MNINKRKIGIAVSSIIIISVIIVYAMKETTLPITLAYRDNDDVMSYYSDNTVAYKNKHNQTVIHMFSSPLETSKNVIESAESGGYIGEGSYMTKILPRSWSQENPIQITYGAINASITPVSGKYSSKLKEVTNAFRQSRDTLVYKDAFGKGINYNVSLTCFGINTETVLSKKTEQNTFQIKVTLPNLIPDTSSPDYILFKTALENGDVNAILYTPLAVDRKGKWSYANTIKLIDKDSETGTYTVEYGIDKAFLKSAKYPVKLNQSIHLYMPKQPDTPTYEKTGDEAGHYLSPYMLLGDKTLKGEGWTYIRYETFNNLNINAEKIASAK